MTTDKKDKKESKRERFVRLAEVRTSAALEGLAKVGQLANTDRYEYTAEDVDKIEQAINTRLAESVSALRAGKVPTAAAFHL